ncbi:hypothetical protein [Sphaerospermopsis sp. FACHB-1194]|nr:hypothetical protein [Sphaerospermopsis sp. FACHB-1194]
MGFADYPPISQNITGVRSQEAGVIYFGFWILDFGLFLLTPI